MAFDFISRLFSAADNGVFAAEDNARKAMAAVLVMAARADGDYAASEKGAIDQALMELYSLSRDGAVALREVGEAAEERALDHYQFTKAIKIAVPYEARASILVALWRVVLADGRRDPQEDALMRQLTDRLGLSSVDSAYARRQAME